MLDFIGGVLAMIILYSPVAWLVGGASGIIAQRIGLFISDGDWNFPWEKYLRADLFKERMNKATTGVPIAALITVAGCTSIVAGIEGIKGMPSERILEMLLWPMYSAYWVIYPILLAGAVSLAAYSSRAVIRLGKGVASLKKKLTSHVEDKNAHR